jgi:hypothetical protein
MAKSRNNRKPGAGKLLRTQVITHHRDDRGKLHPNTISHSVKAKHNKAGDVITRAFTHHKPISKTIIHSRRVAV